MQPNLHEDITIAQLTPKALFKIGFLSNLFFWGVPAVYQGIMAIFNTSPEVIAGMTTSNGIGGFFTIISICLFGSLLAGGVLTIGGLFAGWASNELTIGKLTYKVSAAEARKRQAAARKAQATKAQPTASDGGNEQDMALETIASKSTDKKDGVPEGRLW